MKLRTRDDSLRLRLRRGEVERLGEGAPVEARTRLPGGAALIVRLCPESCATARVSLIAAGVQVTLELAWPRDELRAWASGDAVGLYASVALDGPGEGAGAAGMAAAAAGPAGTPPTLELAVEKDFACLVPRGEDLDGTFPHPRAAEGG